MMLLGGAMALAGCDKYNYVSDFQQMGGRVEVLEGMELKVNEGAQALHEIIMAVEQEGYVTEVKHHDDGSVSVTFNDGKTFTMRQGVDGHDGRDGRDGKEATLLLGVEKDKDGHYYWTLNGAPLTDGNGNRIPAGAIDGQDGRDGSDGKSAAETGATVPLMRINTNNRHWEVSTDGGRTWSDTGVKADGDDGKDGRNGLDGEPDIFSQIKEAADGQSITFVMTDGRTFTVPIM